MPAAAGNHPIETPVRRTPLKIGTTTATFLHATLLDTSKREERPPLLSRERTKISGSGERPRLNTKLSGISAHFRPRRHLLTARDYRTEMTHRFTTWRQATGCAATA
ncbi:hypothetical protein QF037_000371 [Streptomyces canus]|nr:hypothetical protein [Streptomyces canus]